MNFVFIGKMKFKNLLLLVFAYLRLMFVATKKTSTQTEENENLEKYQLLSEKKIHFTGHNAQYIKFNIKISYLLDFSMCIWYKPEVILEHNVLFTYGNEDQQLILWKIKKKQSVPVIILKIFDTMIMEQKIENLILGQWNHLCQYWHGSIGLWALFLNSYIVSFDYIETTNYTNWFLNTENATATINHSRTKGTLQGEIYGFHLMSTNGMQHLFEDHLKFFPKLSKINSTYSTLPNKSSHRKRQVQPVVPANPETRPQFFRVRNFFRFIRRVVALVTAPVARFIQSIIMPWRKKFTSRRPTSLSTTLLSVTEVVTVTKLTTETSTNKNVVSINTNITKSNEEFSKLEQSMVIYESDGESLESRLHQNMHNTFPFAIAAGKSHILIQKAESNSTQFMYEADKCSIMEKNFMNLNFTEIENSVNMSTENPTDAITRLGSHLQFMQILYNCCNAYRTEVLISWMNTRTLISNVIVEEVAGCGDF